MRILAAASCAALLITSSCNQWYTSARTANGYGPDRLRRARVTLVDGSRVQLVDARIRQDSVIGIEPSSAARLALPVTGITRIESQEFSMARTMYLFAGLGLVFLLTAFYAVATQE